MPHITFPKKEKLCGEIRIGKLFTEGKAFLAYPLRIVYRISDDRNDSPVKVIISVPKKKLKLANKRNYIKRMIKEAYRLKKSDLINTIQSKGIKIDIAITYVADKTNDYRMINEKVNFGVDKVIKIFNEN